MAIEVGRKAPLFTLTDQDGRKVALKELRGAPTLLYFYPRDETPGCTTQACGVRDRWSEFQEAGITVVGISPDSVESHASFRKHHGLPQTLLADPGARVMRTYDAWGEKNMYGRVTEGVIRSSVLLDAEGTVVKHWKRAQAKTHAERVLKAAAEVL